MLISPLFLTPSATFRTNSADLVDGATDKLDEQAATLVANPNVAIEVAGHTDADGDDTYNRECAPIFQNGPCLYAILVVQSKPIN